MDIRWLAGTAVSLLIGGIGVWMKVADGSLKNKTWWGLLETFLILTSATIVVVLVLVLVVLGLFGVGVRSPLFSYDPSFSVSGYDKLIPARSSREEAEEGYKKAMHIWAASITGHYFALLPHESRKKIDKAIFVDPNSESMKILASIQEPRGGRFSEDVKDAVALCKSEKIEVRLSSHPVLNVVLFDPETDHAWVRVQEFIPYHLGEESVVYAIRKEEWKDLYETIENSFRQTWENGRDQMDIH